MENTSTIAHTDHLKRWSEGEFRIFSSVPHGTAFFTGGMSAMTKNWTFEVYRKTSATEAVCTDAEGYDHDRLIGTTRRFGPNSKVRTKKGLGATGLVTQQDPRDRFKKRR